MDEVLGNLVEESCNFTMIRGDNCDGLPNHVEASQNSFEVLNQAGFDMATEELRDTFL